jgi:predicted transcriptional regulator/cbb3-type cytochrome oxidase subunit 3
MKRLQISIIFVTMLLMGLAPHIYAKENNKEVNPAVNKILIMGLKDNIQSDYFYKDLIAEESGIPVDSLEQVFNRTIATNIAQSRIDFITAPEEERCTEVINNIRVNGEQENCTSDLSQVDNQCFRDLLSATGAEYVLILNRHFLKKQDQPFNTLFYFISYSLYNKDKQEVMSGSNYFTTMHIESENIMKKVSRKSSGKIASAVLKAVNQQSAGLPSSLLTKY